MVDLLAQILFIVSTVVGRNVLAVSDLPPKLIFPLFYFMHIGVFPACVHHMHAESMEARKGLQMLRLELQMGSHVGAEN